MPESLWLITSENSMNDLRINGRVIKQVELIIFDKDGTLIDIHNYWSSMLRLRAKKVLSAFTFPDPEAAFIELVEAMGVNSNNGKIKACGPVGIKPRAFIEETALKVSKKYDKKSNLNKIKEIFLEVDKISRSMLADFVKPLPGVFEFLEKLLGKRTKMAIATTDITSRAELALKTLSLEKYFFEIAGGDKVKNAKPAPDIIDFILSRLPVSPQNTVIIGDANVDLELAKNSGIDFIGVKTGLFDESFIENSKYLVENLTEIEVV